MKKGELTFRKYLPVMAIAVLLLLILAGIQPQQAAKARSQKQKEDAVAARDMQVHHDADRYEILDR